MSPQDLETARAFVACPKWRWLPGMAVILHASTLAVYAGRHFGEADYEGKDVVPDLDDPVTRAALLVVVREARGEPQAYIGASILNGDGTVRTWAYCTTGVPAIYGNSEVAALLAALQAAP